MDSVVVVAVVRILIVSRVCVEAITDGRLGHSQDRLYAPLLAESEREAVSVLLQYLENVCLFQLFCF